MVEATLEIIDDDSGDLIEQADERYTVNTARVRRDQVRAAQRLTLAARYAPDSYGKAEARPPVSPSTSTSAQSGWCSEKLCGGVAVRG